MPCCYRNNTKSQCKTQFFDEDKAFVYIVRINQTKTQQQRTHKRRKREHKTSKLFFLPY